MNVEEIRKKVRSLCENAGLQFFFAVPNASEWAVTDCEHLRKIVSYHKELETLPLVTPTQKWIPVSERLPDVADGTMGDVSNDVLMCVTDGEGTTISVGFYGYYPNCSTMKGWWCMWAHGCDKLDGKCKVVAWMPLPKVEEVDQ